MSLRQHGTKPDQETFGSARTGWRRQHGTQFCSAANSYQTCSRLHQCLGTVCVRIPPLSQYYQGQKEQNRALCSALKNRFADKGSLIHILQYPTPLMDLATIAAPAASPGFPPHSSKPSPLLQILKPQQSSTSLPTEDAHLRSGPTTARNETCWGGDSPHMSPR